MTNYEVGDTVEEFTEDGTVMDTGVVTRIEEHYYSGVYQIWAMWEVEGTEKYFCSDEEFFRIKAKRTSASTITLETVYKVLSNLSTFEKQRGLYTPEQLIGLAVDIFDMIQAEQRELQRQNNPEYQKYLELKKKFETA